MEPEWKEHDGSAVCPVPAGHDVEMKLRNLRGSLRGSPEVMRWEHENVGGDITHYRDWSAWEQSKMTKADDVPETVPQWAKEKACEWHNRHVSAFGTKWRPAEISYPPDHAIDSLALYIAAHEPAPVDPLREAVEAMRETARELREGSNRDCNQVQQAIMWERRADAVEAELARGVTLTNAGTEPEGE